VYRRPAVCRTFDVTTMTLQFLQFTIRLSYQAELYVSIMLLNDFFNCKSPGLPIEFFSAHWTLRRDLSIYNNFDSRSFLLNSKLKIFLHDC